METRMAVVETKVQAQAEETRGLWKAVEEIRKDVSGIRVDVARIVGVVAGIQLLLNYLMNRGG